MVTCGLKLSLLFLLFHFCIISCKSGDQELVHKVKLSSEDGSGKKLNILMLSLPAIGHLASLLAVGEELVHRGHNVTLLVITNEADKEKYKKHADKYGINLWNVSSEDAHIINLTQVSNDVSKSFLTAVLNERSTFAAQFKIMAKHVNRSLSAGDWDIVTGNEPMKVIISCMHASYKTPFLFIGEKFALSPHSKPHWPWPGILHGASSDNLGFIGRAMNNVYDFFAFTVVSIVLSTSMDALTEYCPSVGIRQALSSIAVTIPHIVPTVIGFEHPRTISPLSNYVGPLVSRSPAPLLGELGEWLKSKSDKSVVYVSMGSMFKLDRDSGRAILEGVMKTNFSMLWSLRKSNQWILEGLDVDPDRVLISDWTPQFSVLGSKATHSAILHGGFNGLSEALWNGIPVIAFPQMVEQVYNAGRVHFNGLGIHLDTKTLSSSKIAESLRALDTGEYRSKVAKLQKAFRIAGGVKRAADLVEFYEDVGYAHLVPAYAKYQWSWVQYYNADVYAVMVLILAILVICLTTCCKCICRKCFCTSKKEKKD